MKKQMFHICLCVLVLGFILSGCTPSPSTSLDESTSVPAPSISVGNLQSFSMERTETPSATAEGYYHIFYKMQSQNAYTYDGFLAYTNLSSEETTILCKAAGCTHANDTCNAFLGTADYEPQLFVLQDTLYLFYPRSLGYTVNDISYPARSAHIESFSINDDSPQPFAELSGMIANHFVYDETYNCLYLLSCTQIAQGNQYSLLRVDLTTGETITVKTFPPLVKISFYAVYENRFILGSSSNIEVANGKVAGTFFYCLETDEVESIVFPIGSSPSSPYGYYVNQNYYFVRETDVIQFNMVTGNETTIFSLPPESDFSTATVFLFSEVDGKMRIHTSEGASGARVFHYYLYDISTENITPYSPILPFANSSAPMDILAETDDGYLLLLDMNYTVPEYAQFVFITKEDYWNGNPQYVYFKYPS